MNKRESTFIVFLVASLSLWGPCSAQTRTQEKSSDTQLSRIQQLFSHTRSVCVGRYTIDIPASAEAVHGPSSVPYEIERHADQAARLDSVVEEIVQKAQERKLPLPIGPASMPGSKVGSVVRGFSDKHRIIYGVDFGTGAFYRMHSVIVLGNDLYVQSFDFFGETTELSRLEDEIRTIASNISPRKDETFPARPGVCIDGAFVSDSSLSTHERTTLGVRFREFGDVHFSIEMTFKTRLVADDALEPRLRSAEERAKAGGNGDWYARIKFLRRGNRKIVNWQGFEALLRRPPQGKYGSFHEFEFASHGEPNNLSLPVVSLELYTGVKGNSLGGISSLTDDEAVELWDKLTGSIRPVQLLTN